MENVRPRQLKRSTHVYCPACYTNLSEYNMKSCEDCGFVFGDIEPVFGVPEPQTKRTRCAKVDEPVLIISTAIENKKRSREPTTRKEQPPLKKSSSI